MRKNTMMMLEHKLKTKIVQQVTSPDDTQLSTGGVQIHVL